MSTKFLDLPPETRRRRLAGKALQLELSRLAADGLAESNATPEILDFSQAEDYLQHATGRWRDEDPVPMSAEGYRLSKQQIYRRQKRAQDAYAKKMNLSPEEKAIKFRKPLSEWDAEELARGRPRAADGSFKGPKPAYIDGEIYEEAMDRFKSIVKTGMRVATVDALTVIKSIINDESTDNRGRPLVAASTKLQAAQFLIEHVVGKPTQRVENDVSIKLQAILGSVMVNPADMATGSYVPGHLPGLTMELAAARDDYEDDDAEL